MMSLVRAGSIDGWDKCYAAVEEAVRLGMSDAAVVLHLLPMPDPDQGRQYAVALAEALLPFERSMPVTNGCDLLLANTMGPSDEEPDGSRRVTLFVTLIEANPLVKSRPWPPDTQGSTLCLRWKEDRSRHRIVTVDPLEAGNHIVRRSHVVKPATRCHVVASVALHAVAGGQQERWWSR
jgi:hypothetical protein